MLRLFSTTNTTILTVIFLGFALWNAFFLRLPLVGALLLAWFLATVGLQLGKAAMPSERGVLRWFGGAWTALGAIAILGAASYYVYEMNFAVAVVLLILAIPLSWVLGAKATPVARAHDAVEGEKHRVPPAVWLSTAVVATLFAIAFFRVASGATTEAVRSLWERVPLAFFFVFGLASAILVSLLLRGRERALTIPLLAVALFLTVSVALIAFPIGYGFDTFIHQATEQHVAQFGTITPKPFYYIGQYALVLFLHFAFAIPVEWADKLLLPTMTALFLPLAWFLAATHLLGEKRSSATALAAVFLFPLASFIVTTPQGLANLWTWLTLLAAVPRLMGRERWPLWPVALAAFATATIHPIAGIPVLLFLVLLLANPADPHQKYPALARGLSWIAMIGGSVILPLSFVLNALLSGQPLKVNLSALSPIRLMDALHLEIFLENRFSPILDFAYLFAFNQVLIIVFMSFIGLILWRTTLAARLKPLVAMAIILFINYVVMSSAVEFTFLIDYERGNYASRLIPLALFFLSPLVILVFGVAAQRLNERAVVLRAAFVFLLAAIMTSTLYLTYPRHDGYETSHGFNMSQTDIDTVADIERDAVGTDYVVLANQTVSAAAIKEFGFVRYYGDLFYYPIPTGGPLYQKFLDMNERPNLETVQAAMDLAGVDLLYYLVNDYWWEADRLIETAKTNASAWWSLGDGAVHVFRYERTPDVFISPN